MGPVRRGDAYMRGELNQCIQASFYNHANRREESFASLQNESRVAGTRLRSCFCILPLRKYTPGLSSTADGTRFPQAHIPTAHYPDAP